MVFLSIGVVEVFIRKRFCLLDILPGQVICGNLMSRAAADDASFKFLMYKLLAVGRWPTVARTGDGGLNKFGSGSWDTAIAPKEE